MGMLQDRPKRELKPSLVFLNGDLLAVPIPLEREEVILGRALEADVRINDSKVSRQHARIITIKNAENDENKFLLTDLSTTNGTFLNGEKINQDFLQNGDKISIGEHILRFDLLDEIDREYQRQIRRLLSHDDLTGLLSSRSFFSELRREVSRAALENRSFCVLMMDLDHFKKVNDTYGHLTGSKTLEEVGNCINSILRNGDVASRFGGEEFAAFLLDAEPSQAMIAAERFRASIEKQDFTVIKQGKSYEIHHITISIGVAFFPDDSEDPIELVEMADSALYRAKRDGRNCVRAHRDLTQEEMESPFPSRSE
jgi:two-component system, cell cycle response regulator